MLKLKEVRERRRMTQMQLAEASGVGQSTISELERGEAKSPSYEVVVKLARALRVPPSRLVTVPEQGEVSEPQEATA